MADIFISYSKDSQSKTRQLANELRAKGFTVWYDTSLVPGDRFRDVIMSELAQARAAIVIWTAGSVKSDWVCSEASRAHARRILIPVRADDVRSHDIPPPFDGLHTELLSNLPSIEGALSKLGVTPKQEGSSALLASTRDPIESEGAINGLGSADKARRAASATIRQEIKYCRTPDGVRLAYAISGYGQPLVKTGNWLNHLEYDWESPLWRHFLRGLSADYRLIRYDPRGTGLSDWNVQDISLDAWVNDIETVIDAAGLDRFPLLGYSQGCAVSIAYSLKYPGRVSHLILYGGFAVGPSKRSPEDRKRRKAFMTLVGLEWGADNPAIRQMFAARMMPEATKEQIATFNELQRTTTSPEGAVR
jgi:hypothetical protein